MNISILKEFSDSDLANQGGDHMKVLMFAPVLRSGSYNKKLIRIAFDYVQSIPGFDPELIEFNDFDMPLYDGDLETTSGIPDNCSRLAKKITEAEAIIISTPEYNGGIPGVFKNAIDWLSRLTPVPLTGKQIILLSATPGSLAGARGNFHTRWPLQVLSAHVYPDYFGLAKAHEAFDEEEKLKDPNEQLRLQKIISDFLIYASREETPFSALDVFLEEQKHSSHHH
jgi:NAD(P)H-dependent FMN reductase